MTRAIATGLLITVVLLSHAPGVRSEPSHPDLGTLLGAFAAMPGLEARFVEEKRMQLLQAPLRSEGRLYFAPPGYLLRRIEKPQPSEVLITPSALIIDDGASREVLDLRARSDVRSFVSSFVSLLAGDEKALRAAYEMSLSARGSEGWQLRLEPKEEPLSAIILRVQVSGKGLAVHEIHVFDTNGDETITRMRDVNPNRRFDESERKVLFGNEGT